MSHNLQHTRNGPRVRRQRQIRVAIPREDILEEVAEAGVPRRVALAQRGVVQRVFFREARFESEEGVFGFDGGFAGSRVAGVQADGFAEELASLASFIWEGMRWDRRTYLFDERPKRLCKR